MKKGIILTFLVFLFTVDTIYGGEKLNKNIIDIKINPNIKYQKI